MQESKEKIKSRMIKNASRLWGYQDTQTESAFDPFVGMLIGSLAEELEKVSEEIAGTESRVVEKLVELLTPEPIVGPFPAHALMQAKPVQSQFTIDPLYQFYLYKKKALAENHSKTEDKTVFFTPTTSFKLFDGRVKYQASGNKLFELKEENFKDLVATSNGNGLPQSTFWIGMELSSVLESLEGLSLYFDIRNQQYSEAFYQSLMRSSWFTTELKIPFVNGFEDQNTTTRNQLDNLLMQDMDVIAKICSHVNRYYRKHFYTISNGSIKTELSQVFKSYPDDFDEVFKKDVLEELDQPLLWLRVELPEHIPSSALEDVYCFINCFPVINRQLNSFTQTSREQINIIPLLTKDTFLDMNMVTNSEGKVFTKQSFSSIGNMEKGAYILRHGGVGRFDSRNAREVLNYLLELLRDESAAFAVLGSDMISSHLRELKQTIARLEQRLEDNQVEKEKTSYLMLKAQPDDDLVFVEFWSTQGVFANNIKAGNALNIYEGSDLDSDSVILISPSTGGRERKDTEERLHTYRKSLLSHDRIVTAEDIIALCYEHFGEALESTVVNKGLMNGPSKKQGFIACIDIHIKLDNRKSNYKEEELQYLKEDLLIKLEERAVNVWPFRCFIS